MRLPITPKAVHEPLLATDTEYSRRNSMEKDNEKVVVTEKTEPANREYLGNDIHGRLFTFDDMNVECFYGDLPIGKILAEVCK